MIQPDYWREAWKPWPKYSPGEQCIFAGGRHPGPCNICETDKPVIHYSDFKKQNEEVNKFNERIADLKREVMAQMMVPDQGLNSPVRIPRPDSGIKLQVPKAYRKA